MAGAAGLVGVAALRSGAGLVRVACPAEVQPTVASFEPCYMTYPLENDDDGLIRSDPAKKALATLLERSSVLAMGPGLGQSAGIRDLVRWVVESVEPTDGPRRRRPECAWPARPTRWPISSGRR